jgi:hypothetical protein
VQISALRNGAGVTQTITFNPPAEIAVGEPPVPLVASSDAGLPVEFFVVSGPAKVIDGMLVLTEIPPRAKMPVTITVAGWQWGRASEPKVKTAEPVRREIKVIRRSRP